MTRQQRGYDAAYDAAHRDWERRFARGETVLCWRCFTRGTRTVLDGSQLWDLGHDDNDRTVLRGPECRGPNRATMTNRLRQPEVHPAVRDLLQHPGAHPPPHP